MPFILNEDKGLKKKFVGLTVTDENAPESDPRPVTVRFRMPETELGNVTFPLIVIDQSDITKADDREHRGTTTLPYIPEGLDTGLDGIETTRDPETGAIINWDTNTDFDVNLSPFKTKDHPVPYNLDYQVTVYTRTNGHLTQLVGDLAAIDRIPARFGYIQVEEDGTVRTLDVLGGPAMDAIKDGDGKRVFRAIYNLRVVSELDLYTATKIANYVTQAVDIDLVLIEDQN